MKPKVDYVMNQPQTRPHTCHWPNCTKQVPPAMWGCKTHWFKIPLALRNKIWAAYRPGQEIDLKPSEQYLKISDEVERWIREHRAI